MANDPLHPHCTAFAAIFEGFPHAYGIYNVDGKVTSKKQGKVKGTAASLMDPVTPTVWSKHLFGKQGLGIIPITSKSEAKFGAIDVDDYNTDIPALARRVAKLHMPLVVCRTKSGGAHLYMFMTEFIPAATVKEKLEEFASILGVGGSEIFPKQTKLLVERGDAGSWINMPYCGGNNSDRYAFNDLGEPIQDIDAFIKFVQYRMVDPETLASWAMTVKEPLGPHAPPCLNCLCTQGFPEGTRNDGLMNLGVLAILMDKDNWMKQLDKWNNEFMNPPLSATEVMGVAKSLKKKEYAYMCKRQPLQAFCNKPLCKTRKYGVKGGTGLPVMGTLTKFDSEPPAWFIDIEGKGRLELSTEDLQQPLRFQKACMEQLDCMPNVMKRDDWSLIVAQLLETVNIVSIPFESSPKGMLLGYLEDFLNVKSQHRECSDNKEVLLRGLVWLHEGKANFRLKDFVEYLTMKRFTEFKSNKIAVILKELNAEHLPMTINYKCVNVYRVDEGLGVQKRKFNVPRINESAL